MYHIDFSKSDLYIQNILDFTITTIPVIPTHQKTAHISIV